MTLDLDSLGGILALVSLVVGTLAFAYAIQRSQALNAWRAAALGYKEDLEQITSRLKRSEEDLREISQKMTYYESQPDLSKVIEAVLAQGELTREAVKSVGNALEDLSTRWG